MAGANKRSKSKCIKARSANASPQIIFFSNSPSLKIEELASLTLRIKLLQLAILL